MRLFIATFTTLLAIINPFEALPIFLGLVTGKDEQERLRIARRACLYALLLMFFFLVFGTVILRVFYRPQEVLTGGYSWPASRAGVASREPGPWSPWRSRRNGRPRGCARWRAAR